MYLSGALVARLIAGFCEVFQAERRADDDQEERETKEGWMLLEGGIYSQCARLRA